MVIVIGSATSVATMWTLLLTFLIVPVLTIHGRQLSLPQTGSAWQDLKSSGDKHGRDKRYVQLTEGETMTSFEPCVHPSGRPGHCKHLHQCGQEELQDNMVYMDYLCVIGTSTIGICCPDPTGQGQEGLAGDLPATALKDEGNDALTRITRAENRGCGISTRAATRLVGARPTSVREWPWMASVTPEGFESYCGGVLITDRHVMTAAHCTRRWKAEELEVLLGEYDFDSKTDTRTYHFRVIEKRQHEDFDNVTYHNDIAILKLDKPATFNTYVWPICLPPPGLNVVNESAYIVGWGTQWFGGPTSHVLMEVSVPVWEHQRCVDSFADSIFDETLCAAAYEGGRDACQGDSGGPLMYQLPSGRWSVLGVVSWGVRCGEATHPGLYTRVDKYLRWIVQNARF